VERGRLWTELRTIHGQQQESWIAMGDYNAIKSVTARPIGNIPTELELRDYKEFLEDT